MDMAHRYFHHVVTILGHMERFKWLTFCSPCRQTALVSIEVWIRIQTIWPVLGLYLKCLVGSD